jgi:hypothetical protein
MKVLKFPAQRIIRNEPAVPRKKRRKRNIIETMIREIEPAMRLFPHVHGAPPADRGSSRLHAAADRSESATGNDWPRTKRAETVTAKGAGLRSRGPVTKEAAN